MNDLLTPQMSSNKTSNHIKMIKIYTQQKSSPQNHRILFNNNKKSHL